MFEGYRNNAHRKTFATNLYALNKDEKGEVWIQEQLGHAPNSKVTKENYVAYNKLIKKDSEVTEKALEYFNISPEAVFKKRKKRGGKIQSQKLALHETL